MLQINEQMHKLWKEQIEGKPSQSGITSWISNLPFDSNVKEWVAAEDKYQKEVQMKNILPAVADKFLIDREAGERGASVLCFDEIQVPAYNLCSILFCFSNIYNFSLTFCKTHSVVGSQLLP